MVIELVALPIILLYIAIGASVHTVWGIYRAYSTLLEVRIKWARVFVEFVAAIFFGLFGAFALSSLMPLPVGIELGGLFSAVLGAHVMGVVTKKFGISKFEVIVSDQQLQPDLNPRQINILQAAQKTGKITSKMHQRLNATTRNVARKDLEKLVVKGKLVRFGSGRGVYYVPRRIASEMRHEKMHN